MQTSDNSLNSQESLWNKTGPILLFGGLAVFLFKNAPSYLPLALTAFFGYVVTHLFHQKGLILSLIALSTVFFLNGGEGVWMSLMIGSLAISLLLVYLGARERQEFEEIKKQEVDSFKERFRLLEKQCETKNLELKRLQALYTEVSERANESKRALEQREQSLLRDLQNAQAQIVSFEQVQKDLSGQVHHANEHVASLQHALEELKKPVEKADEPHISELQHQYTALREQFEEKSTTLDLTRQELFRTENALLTLQKMGEEKECEPFNDGLLLRDLKELEQECMHWENQTHALQELVSALLPKPKTMKRRSKSPSPSE